MKKVVSFFPDRWYRSEAMLKLMDHMGWGGQPYIVFKHFHIEQEHIHIVSVQVAQDGKKIKDSKRNERSVSVTEELEKEYGLHPAKGQKRSELWQLKPVDPARGDLKRQIAAVIKPVLSMYCFQTLGEFRALLSLYNIGMEEVRGERNGNAYLGLLYMALNTDGEKAGCYPVEIFPVREICGFQCVGTAHGTLRRENDQRRQPGTYPPSCSRSLS